MTEELKTLNDIELEESNQMLHEEDRTVNPNKIRQEAIKHIKADYKKWNVKQVNSSKINWIKQFFNITEEDLK